MRLVSRSRIDLIRSSFPKLSFLDFYFHPLFSEKASFLKQRSLDNFEYKLEFSHIDES